jgi:hypothetical protein
VTSPPQKSGELVDRIMSNDSYRNKNSTHIQVNKIFLKLNYYKLNFKFDTLDFSVKINEDGGMNSRRYKGSIMP